MYTLAVFVVISVAGFRALALCVVGVVAVVRAERKDIPAVVQALAGCVLTIPVRRVAPRDQAR